jgi:hypothetical protein
LCRRNANYTKAARELSRAALWDELPSFPGSIHPYLNNNFECGTVPALYRPGLPTKTSSAWCRYTHKTNFKLAIKAHDRQGAANSVELGTKADIGRDRRL